MSTTEIIENLLVKYDSSINNGFMVHDEELVSSLINKQELTHYYCFTDSGFIALKTNCVYIDYADCFFHESLEDSEFIYDEIDNEYILEKHAVCIEDRRHHSFYTHENNANSSNDIYYLSGTGYVTEDYLSYNDYVFMPNGNIEYVDNVYFWESDGEYHYEEEFNGSIESYSYKPKPKFNFIKGEDKNSLFFGLELEIENEEDKIRNKYAAQKITQILTEDIVYLKSDGSLSNGFEIVTHPMSFAFIKSIPEKFSLMLEYLKNNGFRSYNSTTCGMHIHISKENFTTWQLFRFMSFFNDNKEFIVKLSQRDESKLKKWASLSDENRDELMYKTISVKKGKDNFSRYSAINLCNDKTIEIRIFRGTLAQGSFFKNIEFCQALFEYTRDYSIVTLQGFKEYIANKKEFKNLAQFIKLKNL
jgi:hypothetical protein